MKIARMGDTFFKKYFRMNRPAFNEILEKIRPHITKNRAKAVNSSGFSVSPVVKLATALRFLAGGIYLDLAFGFNIPHNTVLVYVWEVLEAIDLEFDNIKFPLGDEEALRELEQGFMRISKGVFQGTVAAGDGVVFRMQKPTREAADGDVASFFTRKGYYAYGMQAFVDSSCKFLSISMKMCSSTHDSTSYLVSDLSHAIKEGKLASWAHIVLDEAYPNTEQELSPYRGRNLDLWKDSFNFHLSMHRQCVERAFGLLVQRWGVFWRPLRVAFHRIPLLIRVACKLHNFCIDRNGLPTNIDVARGDVRSGDIASPLFTDGTGGSYRGRRSDREETNTRASIMNRLRLLGITRPAHSNFSRVPRM